MGWLIFLGVLVLLGCLPLGVRLNFDEGGFRAAALLGRIPVRLYPVPKWLQNMPSKHKKEARPLPWREEPTPYRVWVSEIMLQQTRIEAAREYFNRFTRAFPTVEALAAAELDDVLKLWEVGGPSGS